MTRSIFTLFISGVLLTACNKKKEIFPPPAEPAPIDTATYVQFSITGIELTGEPLFALINIENNTGKPLLSGKKVTVNYVQGKFLTDKISLKSKDCRLTSFIVTKASDTAMYAAPKQGSQKAIEVPKPLTHAIQLKEKGITNISVQVLKIISTDTPGAFGYSSNDFGFQPYITVKVKLKITVGNVLYDSLPGKLKISSANNDGEWERELDLNKGVTAVNVPMDYNSVTFKVNKWNTLALKSYGAGELKNGVVISLEEERDPKKLIEERSYIENDLGFIAKTRTTYSYNANGKISETRFYQKSLQVDEMPLTYVHQFYYTGNQLDSISRLSADNKYTGSSSFTYAADKITNVSNTSYDQGTHAVFEYNKIGDNDIITANYLFSNGNSMVYTMHFVNGNKVWDAAQSSTGGNEGGSYEYDDNINPKHQLGYPDIFLSNYSKNNLIIEHKGYGGAIPSAVPYKTDYVYDDDGYPSEVYISYKNIVTQQHLYRQKKVYYYL